MYNAIVHIYQKPDNPDDGACTTRTSLFGVPNEAIGVRLACWFASTRTLLHEW